MSEQEANSLAIEALREVADTLRFDERYVRMFGDKVPVAVRKGMERREKLLEAVKVLQGRPGENESIQGG